MTNDSSKPTTVEQNSGDAKDPRRALPSVARLIEQANRVGLSKRYGSELLSVQAKVLLGDLRRDPGLVEQAISSETLLRDLEQRLEMAAGASIGRVLNATGIFLHTNLGRAPLPTEVLDGLASLLDAGCDLEVDLGTGKRGDRNRLINASLGSLTGAEAALVVNNNAAALVLALAALAPGQQVIVSRGELVEIGGSFRIPDILQSAGVELVEVGTTNRTHIGDYEAAVCEDTGLLLKVYPSNYRIRGFTTSVSAGELAALGRRRSVPLLVDEGSGLLRARKEAVFSEHQSVASLLEDGCDLVCSSGDKVLGGSQAGLLMGRSALIAQCRKHPLYRALRPSRLVLVVLRAVLDLHQRGQSLPIDRLFVEESVHRQRLAKMVELWHQRGKSSSAPCPPLEVVSGAAYVGGGSAPDCRIVGEVLALDVGSFVARALREGNPAVVGRMRDDRLLLDLRTVEEKDDDALIGALAEAVRARDSAGSRGVSSTESG